MSSYRPQGGHQPSDRRTFPRQDRPLSYNDRRSSSRSPDPRHDSPRRRSPPYDISRGPRVSTQDDLNDGHGRRSPDRRRDRSHDRGVYYNRRRSPSPRRGRAYHDRDRPYDEDDRSPLSRDRSANPARDRSSSRGKPSKEIMMDGLALHLTENDITAELQQHYHVENLEVVRIIRDRQTKQPRRFGFLRFPTLEEAVSFMDRNYPTLYLYGDSSQAEGDPDEAKVRISYGKQRKETRSDEADWICSSCNISNYATRTRCFRCQSLKTDVSSTVTKAANVGDNDASPNNVPSQFLLFRGLETSVTEEVFVRGVQKLNKPTGGSAQINSISTKKGAKVASTTGDTNLGAKEGTLRRILLVRDRRSNDSWRYGFAEYASVEDAQAALTRFNSFDRFTIASKQILVNYIHAGVFVPEFNSTPSTDRFMFSPIGNPSIKLKYWDEDAYVTELVVSASETADSGPKSSVINPADAEGLKPVKESEKAKKRKGQAETSSLSAKKPAPSHLQFWSNRHAELHGIAKNESGSSAPPSDAGDELSSAPTQSFVDSQKNCCYLCLRQFNDAAEANTHERLSELHRANLRDTSKVAKARVKLEKHGIPLVQSQSNPSDLSSEYRDRAKERRRIHGVVNKKGEKVGNKPKSTHPSSDDESTSASAPSKGASLLSKMGYTAGQGLGASGAGMTAPISQDVYVAGVGLGAEGGKVGDAVEQAEKNTKGDYSSWAESVRQGARDRYARLD